MGDSSYNEITTKRTNRCALTIIKLANNVHKDYGNITRIIEVCRYLISNEDPYGIEIPYDTKPKQVKIKDNKLLTPNKLLSLITRR